jgi:hypothetical protein
MATIRCYVLQGIKANRGGSTALHIQKLQIMMRYTNPPGHSPAHPNHAEIPIVDWPNGMK